MQKVTNIQFFLLSIIFLLLNVAVDHFSYYLSPIFVSSFSYGVIIVLIIYQQWDYSHLRKVAELYKKNSCLRLANEDLAARRSEYDLKNNYLISQELNYRLNRQQLDQHLRIAESDQGYIQSQKDNLEKFKSSLSKMINENIIKRNSLDKESSDLLNLEGNLRESRSRNHREREDQQREKSRLEVLRKELDQEKEVHQQQEDAFTILQQKQNQWKVQLETRQVVVQSEQTLYNKYAQIVAKELELQQLQATLELQKQNDLLELNRVRQVVQDQYNQQTLELNNKKVYLDQLSNQSLNRYQPTQPQPQSQPQPHPQVQYF